MPDKKEEQREDREAVGLRKLSSRSRAVVDPTFEDPCRLMKRFVDQMSELEEAS